MTDWAEMTKKVAVELIKKNISTDPRWATRALLRVYQFQTQYEQSQRTTLEQNGVGFTGRDGEFLTSLAEQFQKSGSLSRKQLETLMRVMPKYAGQLYREVVKPRAKG